MTDSKDFGGALACLVDLTIPPPQPPDVYGQWKGGWVDFAGRSVEVGSAHGDPGRFGSGTGAEAALRSGACLRRLPLPRPTPSGCTASTTPTSRRPGSATQGIVPFGCLREVTARRTSARSTAAELLGCPSQATPFWRSSGSTPSANQYASSRCG